ncbi:MAG TPA: hypothetical protein VF006_09040 [Longimicrobium sp.]
MLLELLFVAFIIFLIIGIAIHQDRPLLEHAVSHWHQTIDGLTGTPSEFYEAVQDKLREQNIPGIVTRPISFREGGILSDKRDYLRIRREEISYDLCVASFGNTLFISSWLCRHPNGFLETCLSIPGLRVVTAALLQLFKPETYYRVDSALIVQGAIHSSVLAVLDEKTSAQGLEPIPEADRRPVLRELYQPKGRR